MTEFIERFIVASIVFVAVFAYGLKGFDRPDMPSAQAEADLETVQDSNAALSGPAAAFASRPGDADLARIRSLGR